MPRSIEASVSPPVLTSPSQIDDFVREALRKKRDDAFAESVQAGSALSVALSRSLCAALFCRDPVGVLPTEVGLHMLSYLALPDRARFARASRACAGWVRASFTSRQRLVGLWGKAPVEVRRAFVKSRSGFVLSCDHGPLLSPRDPHLFLTQHRGRLSTYRLDAAQLTEVCSVNVPAAQAIAWYSEGRDVLWARREAANVTLWRTPAALSAAPVPMGTVPHQGTVDALVPQPHGGDLLAVGAGCDVMVIRAGEVVGTLANVRADAAVRGGAYGAMRWCDTAPYLAVVGTCDVRIFDMSQPSAPRLHNIVPGPVYPWQHIVWQPGAQRVAMRRGADVQIWDVAKRTPTQLATLVATCRDPVDNDRLAALAFSPGADVLAVHTADRLALYCVSPTGLTLLRIVATDAASMAGNMVWRADDPASIVLLGRNHVWLSPLRAAF